MAGTTNVPPLRFEPAGLVLPTEDAIRAGVFADWNAAMGGNLNPGLTTPQGQKITTEAAIIAEKNAHFAEFVNGVDPATSRDRMQDGIGKLYGLERLPAAATTVKVACMGRAGTIITAGAMVQDTSGNLYRCTAGASIPVEGSVTLPFENIVAGPIPCPVGAINGAPYRTIPGWDRASNTVDGDIGRHVESRGDFEYRRRETVGRNGRGTVQAIKGEVIAVDGVIDAYCIDNYGDTPIVKDGMTIVGHSVYVAAVGGTDAAVAAAVWRKAGGGCNMNGNTSVTVTDDSDYALPKPTYAVKFQRPAELPVYFNVTVQNLSGLPDAEILAGIKNAIVAAFMGSDPAVPRARIASTIIATQYVVPVVKVGTMAIMSIFVGIVPNPVANSLYIGIGTFPTIDTSQINVTFV